MTRLADVASLVFTVDIAITCENEVLMFRRSPAKKTFPGVLLFPGGHIEAGEDPLAAAIREVKEEVNVDITASDICLKYVAHHLHEDRGEMYIIYGFLATIGEKAHTQTDVSDGTAEWKPIRTVMNSSDVFAPVSYYLKHMLDNTSGILYNSSVWKNATLVRVDSETVDASG